ncbi:carbon-nitrogen hydrolase [Dichotomocladium elegans]|nr:carbon-nitrogen hydrolase [Dichotomocladium elegans]
MKIGCCQFMPVWGERHVNMTKATAMLKEFKAGDIDLLVLPELAFTGYVFHNPQEIEPFVEDEDTGPTVQWAKDQARRLQCFVVVGYPECTPDDKYYNSLCCVDPQGTRIATYRKTFLYTVDENWACEGPGFISMAIDGLGKVGFGICMDLNPYQFKSEFEAYEFARFHVGHQTQLIICCMAWLKNDDVTSTIRYWLQRLFPLIENGSEFRFVACNRTGTERGDTFAGGSCVVDIRDQEIETIRYMGESEQGVMVVEVDM